MASSSDSKDPVLEALRVHIRPAVEKAVRDLISNKIQTAVEEMVSSVVQEMLPSVVKETVQAITNDKVAESFHANTDTDIAENQIKSPAKITVLPGGSAKIYNYYTIINIDIENRFVQYNITGFDAVYSDAIVVRNGKAFVTFRVGSLSGWKHPPRAPPSQTLNSTHSHKYTHHHPTTPPHAPPNPPAKMSTSSTPIKTSPATTTRKFTPDEIARFERRVMEAYTTYHTTMEEQTKAYRGWVNETNSERDAAISKAANAEETLRIMKDKLNEAEERAEKAEGKMKAMEKEMQKRIDDAEERVRELEKKLAKRDNELEFLKAAFRHVEGDGEGKVKDETPQKMQIVLKTSAQQAGDGR
ncbi:hypothetical protein B0T16DRAFT_459123 [Cercophora newfieldiana]|uniref:Uncharacterized protein n=1 Tax=Cercophora newfieldiana TaxID=92897 RepID=A0AA40CL41_9PEZI|nr:hypothetical protein B0T16DRAFT_459123 [Cercophora newfieldiana]